VGFDVTPVISGRTGIARYVTELGAALERDGAELRRFAIGRRSFPLPDGARHVRVPARLVERWWRSLGWPTIEQLAGEMDVVHATGLLTPRTRRPLVVTVHDIAAVRYPELHPARHVNQQRSQLRMLHRVPAIVTVSQATADDLVHLGISSERIVVARPGRTQLPEPAAPSVGVSPAGRYLLTVGETSPRKGYGVVVEALARLDHNLNLVMAGPAAGDEQRLRELIATLGLWPRVRKLGAVTDAALAGLYRGAVALCYPSVAEGFGSPVLEAMGAGVPVLASDIPVLRELAGDAAVYVEGNGVDAWADAIEGIVSDASLRHRLAELGRKRAAEFTWERAAIATLTGYRLALDAAP
jgi:glycosyltransferase involved in cell wall biosynthesis